MTLQNGPSLVVAPESWERRLADRVDVVLPVRAAGVHGETRNVCSNGLYFETTDPFVAGTRFEFSLLLPRGALAGTVQVNCKGRVVRVDSRGSVKGIAIAVRSFRFEIKADEPGSRQPSPPPFRLF